MLIFFFPLRSYCKGTPGQGICIVNKLYFYSLVLEDKRLTEGTREEGEKKKKKKKKKKKHNNNNNNNNN